MLLIGTFNRDSSLSLPADRKTYETAEQGLVRQIAAWTGSAFIGDDCAYLPDFGLVTTDTLVEGEHFRLDWTDLESLGYKSCAVNLSDIAAMGGRPRYITVALSLPRHFEERQVKRFYQGVADCAAKHRALIVGGDLTACDKLIVSITALGQPGSHGVLYRSGAKAGDLVVASGTFGESALGLSLLLGNCMPAGYPQFADFYRAHFRPEPKVAAGLAFAEATGGRGALMDSSDGLADALLQIARASGVALELDRELVLAENLRQTALARGLDPYKLALYGGEDYELVGTLSAVDFEKLKVLAPQFRVIGRVSACSVANDESRVTVIQAGSALSGEAACLDLSNCFQHFW